MYISILNENLTLEDQYLVESATNILNGLTYLMKLVKSGNVSENIIINVAKYLEQLNTEIDQAFESGDSEEYDKLFDIVRKISEITATAKISKQYTASFSATARALAANIEAVRKSKSLSSASKQVFIKIIKNGIKKLHEEIKNIVQLLSKQGNTNASNVINQADLYNDETTKFSRIKNQFIRYVGKDIFNKYKNVFEAILKIARKYLPTVTDNGVFLFNFKKCTSKLASQSSKSDIIDSLRGLRVLLNRLRINSNNNIQINIRPSNDTISITKY